MAFSVAAGTLLKISAGVPATFDAAGYAALTFTTVGEINDIQPFGSKWGTSANTPLALRGKQLKKTGRDPGTLSASLKLDTDNAGQILCKAARDSATAIYAASVTTPNGDIYYCQVVVTEFTVTIGSQSSDQTANFVGAVTTSSTDVDWVESLAA